MKNILKFLTLIAVVCLVAVSCDYDDTNFELLTNDVDPNATFYVQLKNNALTAQTDVASNGDLINVESTILISLMGLPQDQDITATLTHDPSSTLTESMYTLSANTVTIPAGESTASVDFSTVAENLPECDPVTLIVNLNAGENTTPSDRGNKLVYNIRRIVSLPLDNGFEDLAGGWGIEESLTNGVYYDEGNFTAQWDGTDMIVSGLGAQMIVDFWGEPVVAGGTCKMQVAEDGSITIPRQYIFTTIYNGVNYDYEIEGTGIWGNYCGEAPVIKITYDIYYPGDAVGLAGSYSSYFGNSVFGGTFVLQ